MSFEYSEGKKKVQKHAGVEYEAQRLTGMVKNYVASHGQQFIQNQTFLIISSVDENGALWTSIIKGNQKGFVHFLSPEKVEIDIKHIDFNPNDILYKNIVKNENIGILFIEFANRRRFRINGKAQFSKNKIQIEIQQAFPNCPKYIQARDFLSVERERAITDPSKLDLSSIQKIVTKADTFLMGTQAKVGSVDTSHRGSMNGFLKFVAEDTIRIPDYSGNNMFLSLGNIIENPNTGLLFIGFEAGSILQLSGKAYVKLDEDDFEHGIERFWYFKIEKNIFTQNALLLNWSAPHYSPFNPKL